MLKRHKEDEFFNIYEDRFRIRFQFIFINVIKHKNIFNVLNATFFLSSIASRMEIIHTVQESSSFFH